MFYMPCTVPLTLILNLQAPRTATTRAPRPGTSCSRRRWQRRSTRRRPRQATGWRSRSWPPARACWTSSPTSSAEPGVVRQLPAGIAQKALWSTRISTWAAAPRRLSCAAELVGDTFCRDRAQTLLAAHRASLKKDRHHATYIVRNRRQSCVVSHDLQ